MAMTRRRSRTDDFGRKKKTRIDRRMAAPPCGKTKEPRPSCNRKTPIWWILPGPQFIANEVTFIDRSIPRNRGTAMSLPGNFSLARRQVRIREAAAPGSSGPPVRQRNGASDLIRGKQPEAKSGEAV